MRQVINAKPKERLLLNDIETKIKQARNSSDYIIVNFGKKGEFIKIAFCKDQTYCIGYNFINIEFMVKTNVMLKMYPKIVNQKLALYLFDWVNRLNR